MTTVSVGGDSGLSLCQEKTGRNHRLSVQNNRRSSYPNLPIVVFCGGLWQEIFDSERPYSLNWDACGTVPKPGSIDGVTRVLVMSPVEFDCTGLLWCDYCGG
jgi:hypothetical protein